LTRGRPWPNGVRIHGCCGPSELRHGGIRFAISVMVDSSQAVDEVTETLRQARGRATKEQVDAESFEGRSVKVADPDGNDSR
jgi:predicted lactoylglutathione lyase